MNTIPEEIIIEEPAVKKINPENLIKIENEQGLFSISQILSKKFVVARYQRGYKWGIEQVRQLLEDIYNFSKEPKGGFYCLQPVILTRSAENPGIFEVIDGQQRLTTIFLILSSMGKATYQLRYQTRERSEEFLKNISTILTGSFSIELTDDRRAEKELNEEWEKFRKTNPHYNNIDNYHFFKAYHFIRYWLYKKGEDVESFTTTLEKRAKVIWYVLPTVGGDVEKIFINFNKGKINLDQADLIKAEFILRLNSNVNNRDIRELKAQEFASEWNSIENFLQNDEFWYFLTNKKSVTRTYNRIDLLFDLIQDKRQEKDRLYSYFQFHKKGFRIQDWQEVKNLFEILKEWFLDRSTYHLIGFILNERLKGLNELRKIYSKSENKQSFVNKLKEILRKKYENEEGLISLDNIYYSESKACTSVLLLYNIAIEERNDTAFRFPFHRFKTQSWNLEHIHAQKTAAFKFVGEVNDWLIDMERLKNHYTGDLDNSKTNFPSEKILELKGSLGELNEELNTNQKDLINDINEIFKEYFNSDHISNLCLLDESTNKSIGNNPFYLKRQEVLSIAEKGKNGYDDKLFIPTGTQRVFSKFYHFTSEKLQMTYWGSEEREIYTRAIRETINEFWKQNELK